jgi:hypothetical protein
MKRVSMAAIGAVMCAGAVVRVANAQESQSIRDSVATVPSQSLVLVNGDSEDEFRTQQLYKGVAPGKSLLLRSATTLTPRLSLRKNYIEAAPIAPQLLIVRNSDLPFSQNNSAMWAGRGASSRIITGFRLAAPHVTLVFAPQIIASDNQHWKIRGDYYQPPWPEGFEGKGYTLPYNLYTFPIDAPLRFGNERVRDFNMGESTLSVDALGFEAGVSNENQWWGPGIRNAMILSNNAPGFPHLFFRTRSPISTPIGGIDFNWLVGELSESRYFDTVAVNNIRSLAAIGVTLQTRWDPNLSVGFARSVYATAEDRSQIAGRFTDVFHAASAPDTAVLTKLWRGNALRGGRDQLMSLFARWVFPKNGAEVYGEWGRTRLPASLANFLKAPNHTQGYTLGMQWRGRSWGEGSVRLQGELTQLEQSATFRDGPVGSWYTSSRVIQGYTNDGQVIGASIGPGASSQFVAADYLAPSWRAGIFAGRIRTNEDVHSNFGFPEYVAYCNHDVTLYPGVRGAWLGSFGTLAFDYSLQNRLNVFFQNSGGCPNNGNRTDIRNGSLTIRFSPFSR